MAVIKKGQNIGVFTPKRPVGKHFHDHDETWVVLEGRAKAYMIDRDGKRDEFILEAGDCWMIEVGVEHGADPMTPEFKLIWIHGTMPPGCHKPAHYCMEEEGYIPSFKLTKTPTNRYGEGVSG